MVLKEIQYNITMIKHLNKTLEITETELNNFLAKRINVRLSKSKKYVKNERVTPCDTLRAKGREEYLFVSSMRWEPYGKKASTYGGYILFNPRTNQLISCTNIFSLDDESKNVGRYAQR